MGRWKWTGIWMTLIIVFLLMLAVTFSVRHFQHSTAKDFEEQLSAESTYAYSIISLAMLFVLAGAAIVALSQLNAIQQQTHVSAVIELYREYAAPEMLNALKAVADPRNRPAPDKMQEMRRQVSHYWHMVGVLYKKRVIKKDLLHMIITDSIRIWPQLEPFEIANEIEIRRRNGNNEPLEQLVDSVTCHIRDTHAGYQVYLHWLEAHWIVDETSDPGKRVEAVRNANLAITGYPLV